MFRDDETPDSNAARGNAFQSDVRGALRNINEALQKLRKDVDDIRARDSRGSRVLDLIFDDEDHRDDEDRK